MASGFGIADTTDDGSLLELIDLRFLRRPKIGSGKSAHAVPVDPVASAGIAVLTVLVALVSASWNFQAYVLRCRMLFPLENESTRFR